MQERVAGSQLAELNDRDWLWQRCREEADDGKIAVALGVTAEVVRKARRRMGIRREKGKPVFLEPDWIPPVSPSLKHTIPQYDPALRTLTGMIHCERCRWSTSPLIMLDRLGLPQVIDRKIERGGEGLVHVGCGGKITLYMRGRRACTR